MLDIYIYIVIFIVLGIIIYKKKELFDESTQIILLIIQVAILGLLIEKYNEKKPT